MARSRKTQLRRPHREGLALRFGAEVEPGKGWYAMIEEESHYFIVSDKARDTLVGPRAVERAIPWKQ